MNHGTRANKGCNLGSSCKDFHPKMCPMSITKAECFDQSCTHCHVKGTKRRKVPLKKPETNRSNSNDKDSPPQSEKPPDQSFLGQINLLKKELQERMESKITALVQMKSQPSAVHPATLKNNPLVTPTQQFQQAPTLQTIPQHPVQLNTPPIHQFAHPLMQYSHPATIPWMNQYHPAQRMPQYPVMGY